MVILGIDPGTANTGYGILTIDRNIRVTECGSIYTSAATEMPGRLKIIYQRVSDLIKEYHPDEWLWSRSISVRIVKPLFP